MTWRPLRPSASELEPRRLGPSLERLARQMGLPTPSLLGAVFARWPELVGPDIAGHTRPVTVRDGVLTVATDHPAWASSLRLLSADVLGRIREVTGDDRVTELVVRVDGARRRSANPRPDTPLW